MTSPLSCVSLPKQWNGGHVSEPQKILWDLNSFLMQIFLSLQEIFVAVSRLSEKVTPARKLYRIGHLFTLKKGDLGAISVTERSCAALVSKVKSHISDRCSYYTPDKNTFSLRHEKQSRVPARGTQHEQVVETLGTLWKVILTSGFIIVSGDSGAYVG